MSKNGKVLVAMSGGIDSSIAALLLHEQGYDVIGITMKTWDYALGGSTRKETGCCNLDTINDARNVAVDLGFPHYVIDIRAEFGQVVIQNFVDEYLAGRTPNPCVLCNTHIKWESLLEKADKLGCEFIATGHYANVRLENGRYILSRGKDQSKDQSYALWGVSQKNLSRSIFPLGDKYKTEIREIALKLGYTDLANKSESYEICFIPDNDYRSFLKKKVNGNSTLIQEGDFVLDTGEVVGRHKGYPFYTIGQRKGLGIGLGYPIYVSEINARENKIILAKLDDIHRQSLTATNINWIKYEQLPENGIEAITQIRYNDRGHKSRLYVTDEGIESKFDEPVFAIAPGQSSVFYENEDVVAGGIIDKSVKLPNC